MNVNGEVVNNSNLTSL